MSASKKNPDTKNTSREEILMGLPARITALLKTESDRGVILILAAYIEEILGLIIADACITNAAADAILNHRQPAGDFDSRMLIAHAFGLIHEEDVKGLRLVQRIRNKAAHFDRSGRGFDVLFDSSATISQVKDFYRLFGGEVAEKDPIAIRAYFITSSRNLANRLLLRSMDVKRAAPLKTFKAIIEAILQKYEGTPTGNILKTLKENPDIKHLIESLAQLKGKVQNQQDIDGKKVMYPVALAIIDALSWQTEAEDESSRVISKQDEPTQ